ncbi:UNVERIFIED_CONTAM: Serine/threonine-protein phosphatase 7 long form [Sesamum radiatum]|uniref:Serine/threonine-protein phosphatase 7 long form n=1 Tax=Sesamum radiatum TaxID=300843 RepID=A0AAW2RG52_SESRA
MGFLGVLQCGHIEIDQHLITALVERWRPETHTFYFPIGEATVTLQDIAIIWALPLEGNTCDSDSPFEEVLQEAREIVYSIAEMKSEYRWSHAIVTNLGMVSWSYHISQTHAAHNAVRIIRNTFDRMKQNEVERVGQMIIDYNNAPTDYPSVRQLMASHHQTHQEIMEFLETRYPPVYSGATLYNSGNEAGPSNARNEAGPSTQHTPANMAYLSNSDTSNLPFVEDEYAINPVLRRHYEISPVSFEHLDSPAQNTDQRQEQPARRNRRRPRCGTGGHY